MWQENQMQLLTSFQGNATGEKNKKLAIKKKKDDKLKETSIQ